MTAFKPCGLTNLTERRSESLLGQMRFDGVKHLALAVGQRAFIRTLVALLGREGDGAHDGLLS